VFRNSAVIKLDKPVNTTAGAPRTDRFHEMIYQLLTHALLGVLPSDRGALA
jgi:hypothetical protein